MSHFTVLVIGSDVDEQLAPYHEFECTGRNDQYVQEIDQTDESRADYEKSTRRRYKDPDGNLVDPYEDRFYREFTEEEKKKHGTTLLGSGGGGGISWHSKDWNDGKGYRAKVHFLPDGWEEVDEPVKNIMSLRDFIDYEHSRKTILAGETPDVEEEHKYGYTVVDKNGDVVKTVRRTNPNRQWDWYQIGGRWQGFFKLKPNGTGEIGKAGLQRMDSDYKKPSQDRADQTTKGMIDFAGMIEDKRQEAYAQWDLFYSVTKDLPLWITWKEVLERYPNEIDKGRDFYHAQPVVKALRDNKETAWFDVDDFRCTRDEYADRAGNGAIRTFAIVKDGQWYSRGRMGWWGVVHDEQEDGKWEAEFTKLLKELPDDTLLTVVDCHI